MKVSEIIVRVLEAWSLQDVFMVTGGGSMHLNDSFGRSAKIKTILKAHQKSMITAMRELETETYNYSELNNFLKYIREVNI